MDASRAPSSGIAAWRAWFGGIAAVLVGGSYTYIYKPTITQVLCGHIETVTDIIEKKIVKLPPILTYEFTKYLCTVKETYDLIGAVDPLLKKLGAGVHEHEQLHSDCTAAKVALRDVSSNKYGLIPKTVRDQLFKPVARAADQYRDLQTMGKKAVRIEADMVFDFVTGLHGAITYRKTNRAHQILKKFKRETEKFNEKVEEMQKTHQGIIARLITVKLDGQDMIDQQDQAARKATSAKTDMIKQLNKQRQHKLDEALQNKGTNEQKQETFRQIEAFYKNPEDNGHVKALATDIKTAEDLAKLIQSFSQVLEGVIENLKERADDYDNLIGKLGTVLEGVDDIWNRDKMAAVSHISTSLRPMCHAMLVLAHGTSAAFSYMETWPKRKSKEEV